MGIRVCVRAARSPVRPAAAGGGAETPLAPTRGALLTRLSQRVSTCNAMPARDWTPSAAGLRAPLQRGGGRQQLAAAVRAAAVRAGTALAGRNRRCGGGRNVSASASPPRTCRTLQRRVDPRWGRRYDRARQVRRSAADGGFGGSCPWPLEHGSRRVSMQAAMSQSNALAALPPSRRDLGVAARAPVLLRWRRRERAALTHRSTELPASASWWGCSAPRLRCSSARRSGRQSWSSLVCPQVSCCAYSCSSCCRCGFSASTYR